MNVRSIAFVLLICCVCLVAAGCNAPGKPMQQIEARPGELSDFPTLYKQNCAACHGERGRGGAAISLANPVYLATAGTDNIKRITSDGVHGTAMPPFGKGSGGMLTARQIGILADGMVQTWGHPSGGELLPFSASKAGDVVNGGTAYASFCARCHGQDGAGAAAGHTGSIVDPSYLALVSDQNLRSTIVAGLPEQGMPDWRSESPPAGQRAMTDQEVTDIVAWLGSHRVIAPGQPYGQQR